MLCRPIQSFSRHDVARAGGKGANLGELMRAGFDVPPGFIVTTDAYRLATAGEVASSAVEMPDEVADAVRDAYRDLGEPAVAVRSSATAEDLPGAAFAGQQETYLNIVGADAVAAAVADCWASLWSERATSYRARLGIDPASVAMAVVVQRLIPADHAGVAFSADPVTGERSHVVVDSHPGLGESVVSGAVTPDHALVGVDGTIVERRAGSSDHVLRAEDGGGTRIDVSTVRLTDRAVQGVAATVRRIAAHMGAPQDVEWAIADGRLWIVQARPMTALPPPIRELSRFQRFYGPVLLELLPRRPLPLELTAWALPIIAPLVERMLAEMAGMRMRFVEMLDMRDGGVEEFVPPVIRPSLHVPRRLIGSLRRAGRLRADEWTRDPRYAAYRRQVDDLRALELHILDWPDLLGVLARVRRASHILTDLRVAYLPSGGVAIARLHLVARMLGLRHLAAAAMTGADSLTRQANRELGDLADGVRHDERLRGLFAAHAGRDLAAAVAADAAAADFRTRFAGFLERFGHRESTSLLMVRDPSWSADPTPALDVIRLLAGQPPERADVAEQALAAFEAHPIVRRLALGACIRTWTRSASAGVALREDSHFEYTRLMPVVRDTVVEIGRRLAASGAIEHAGDVWYLTWNELIDLREITGVDLRAIVERRRTHAASRVGAPLINTASLYPPQPPGDALVTGIPGGGGRVSGPVRIVRTPAEFGRLEPGDVLVCPATNPSWTPLFTRAAAVVVDHGGPASHAAIVAREYGLPAVMGTGTATSVLTEGSVVLVDGDAGVVRADG